MRRVLTLLQATQARFWVLDYSFDYSCNKLKFGTNARFGYSSSKHHHCATIIHIDSLTRGIFSVRLVILNNTQSSQTSSFAFLVSMECVLNCDVGWGTFRLLLTSSVAHLC